MEINIKVCLNKAKETEKELITTQLVKYIREDGSMAEFKGSECVSGPMAKNIKVSGRIIKNMGRVFTLGPMEENTKVITETIKSMDMVLILGLTSVSTSESGRTIKDTEKGPMLSTASYQKKGFGSKTNASNGLNRGRTDSLIYFHYYTQLFI